MTIKKNKIINIINLAFLIPFTIASCSNLPSNTQKSIKEADQGVEAAESALKETKTIQKRNFVTNSDDVYFGSEVTNVKSANLPAAFNKPVDMDQTFTSMSQLADIIHRISGAPVLVNAPSQLPKPVRVTQEFGTLSDLIDMVCNKTDTAWDYSDGKILIQQYETKTWTLKNLPGNLKLQNQINNTAGMQGSGGGSTGSASSDGSSGGGGSTATTSSSNSTQQTTQNVSFNYNGDYWKALDQTIKKLISKDGTYSINDQTSSVTVTDRPSVIARINDYVIKQNSLMNRQVIIDVQVISVETKATDNYGINWNAALSSQGFNFTMNGQAAQISQSGASSFVPSPVYVPSSTTQAFTFGIPANSGAALSGSQLIINALSSIGKVSNVISTAAATVNNQPVPINFTDQISYLASVMTTQTAQVGSQTALTPGQLTVGFSMNVLPVIEDDGMIRLQTSISMSNLKSMNTYASGGSSIQLPNIGNRSFMQKIAIRDGDVFVVTGFDSGLNSYNQSGVGGVNNWLLGGGVTAEKSRQKLVILITPKIISNN